MVNHLVVMLVSIFLNPQN